MERRKRNCIAFKQHWEHMRRWCVVVISCELAARQPQHSATQILDFGLSTVHVVRMYVSWHVYSFHFLFFSFYFVYRFSMQVLFLLWKFFQHVFNSNSLIRSLSQLPNKCDTPFQRSKRFLFTCSFEFRHFFATSQFVFSISRFLPIRLFFFLLCDSFSFWTVENGGKVQWRIWWRA